MPCVCRGPRRGRGDTGPNPTDRSKSGTKHHVLTDAQGIPLAAKVTAANVNEVTQVFAVLTDLQPGRRQAWPQAGEASTVCKGTAAMTRSRCGGFAPLARDHTHPRGPVYRERQRAGSVPLVCGADALLAARVWAIAATPGSPDENPRGVPPASLCPNLYKVLNPLNLIFPNALKDMDALLKAYNGDFSLEQVQKVATMEGVSVIQRRVSKWFEINGWGKVEAKGDDDKIPTLAEGAVQVRKKLWEVQDGLGLSGDLRPPITIINGSQEWLTALAKNIGLPPGTGGLTRKESGIIILFPPFWESNNQRRQEVYLYHELTHRFADTDDANTDDAKRTARGYIITSAHNIVTN